MKATTHRIPAAARFLLWFTFVFLLLCFLPGERGKRGRYPLGIGYVHWGLQYPQEQVLFPIHVAVSLLITVAAVWVHRKSRSSLERTDESAGRMSEDRPDRNVETRGGSPSP